MEESFSSLKFLAFVLTVYNLVSIVTSTSNNNLNNNNLNSNDFSGNVNFSGNIFNQYYKKNLRRHNLKLPMLQVYCDILPKAKHTIFQVIPTQTQT